MCIYWNVLLVNQCEGRITRSVGGGAWENRRVGAYTLKGPGLGMGVAWVTGFCGCGFLPLVTGYCDLVCSNKVCTSTYDWKLLGQRQGHYKTFPSHWVQFFSRPQGALLVCSAVLSDLILSCDVVNMLASECFFYCQWCYRQVTKGISIV